MNKTRFLRQLSVGVAFCWITGAMAGPAYTGTAPACTALTASGTCSINLLDFMKSKFDYTVNSVRYTSDSTNLNSSLNSAATSAFAYVPRRTWYNYDVPLINPSQPVPTNSTYTFTNWYPRYGYMNHPTLPNVLLTSTGENATSTLAYVIWDGGMDNSAFVLSEAAGTAQTDSTPDLFKSFGTFRPAGITTGMAPPVSWFNRGYYWFDKKFDVTINAGATMSNTVTRELPQAYYDLFTTASGAKNTSIGGGGQRSDSTYPRSYAQMVYYPVYNASWLANTNFPGAMEMLELTYGGKSASGVVLWWEKYYYGRQRLADGSYNSFGLIRFLNSQPNKPICVNGIPPSTGSNASCGPENLMLQWDAYYSLRRATDYDGAMTVKQWYDAALDPSNKWKNDVKMTLRSDPNLATLPHVRGGFMALGSGSDAKGALITSATMVYLENSLVDQDWYMYANGEDPLYPFPTVPSPSDYCRDGYMKVGSMVVNTSFNGLMAGEKGSVANKTGLHWVIMCGTSKDAYLNASNSGEASCAPGWTTRTWFGNPSHSGVSMCPPGAGCSDGSAKDYVNFCVKSVECGGGAGACIGSTANP